MAWGVYFFLALTNRLFDWVNRRLRRRMYPEPEGEPRLRNLPRRDQASVLHDLLQGEGSVEEPLQVLDPR